MESHSAGIRRVFLLAFCVAGIWAAYIYQGVLQETVSTKRFGPDKKRFEHLAFLNLAQNVVCLIWSFFMIKIWSDGGNGGAPWWSFWSAGITNTIGPAMGIEALKYISYPAQACSKFYTFSAVVLSNFIFLTISRFGSLTNTTVTTTRKFVSIVVSSLLSGNPLSKKQWGSVIMVFSGLSYQIYLKWKKLQKMQKKRKST
ncbi:hypothetical protein CDL12_23391 [Handroanthus impetiginosus]|uniref:UDP-galactose transporter related protein n=1 Tax=Handroanthus impetiginosus TaxID=429701 RepID=A0A2G9GFK8_9LAMI|nr:hypothetical protein CDL12_23391 [Handroanthus impetiginosus]